MTHPLLCDWAANRGNIKGQLVMFLFRLAAAIRAWPAPAWMIGIPYLAFYTIFVEWFLGIEIRYRTRIGPGLRLFHAHGLVIHESTVIGAGCTLRQSTTIGNKTDRAGRQTASPIIGDSVDIGANVVIIGPITIGDRATIGAGSVVTKPVAPGAIVAGNPARDLSVNSVSPPGAAPREGRGGGGD